VIIMTREDFDSVERALLELVTGGRVSQGPQQADPQLLQAMQQIAESVKQLGAGMAQAKSSDSQGMQQMMQQMMQARGGGGAKH
jgi:hypothetical protein